MTWYPRCCAMNGWAQTAKQLLVAKVGEPSLDALPGCLILSNDEWDWIPQCEDLSRRHVLVFAMHQDPQPFTMLQFIMRCSVGSFVSFLCCFIRRLVSWMPPLLKCRLKCAPFCWKQTRILIKRMDTAIGPVNE